MCGKELKGMAELECQNLKDCSDDGIIDNG